MYKKIAFYKEKQSFIIYNNENNNFMAFPAGLEPATKSLGNFDSVH